MTQTDTRTALDKAREALDAAIEAGHSNSESSLEDMLRLVDDAREALSALSAIEAEAVGVKALEWKDERNCECSAETIVGTYEVGFDDGWWAQLEGGSTWDWEPEFDPRSYEGPYAAKAAAQADYERRIRSALTTSTAPVAEAVEVLDRKRFEQAPCYICGYNGPGYYQPSNHSCARAFLARHKGGDDA